MVGPLKGTSNPSEAKNSGINLRIESLLILKSDVKRIMDYLKKFQNLQMIGRNGTFRYNNMDHSVEMGLYAAWNIMSGSRMYNVDSVNIEREYLEEKKIENIEDTPLDEK